MTEITIKSLKKLIPKDMSIGDTGDLANMESRGGGKDKFVSADKKTLAYWVTYSAGGLCRNCWTVEMWAEQWKEIDLQNFYKFLHDVVIILSQKSKKELGVIWEGGDKKFDKLFEKTLQKYVKQ